MKQVRIEVKAVARVNGVENINNNKSASSVILNAINLNDFKNESIKIFP